MILTQSSRDYFEKKRRFAILEVPIWNATDRTVILSHRYKLAYLSQLHEIQYMIYCTYGISYTPLVPVWRRNFHWKNGATFVIFFREYSHFGSLLDDFRVINRINRHKWVIYADYAHFNADLHSYMFACGSRCRSHILHNTCPSYARGANFRISHVHTCFMFSEDFEDLSSFTLNMTWGIFYIVQNTNLQSYFFANLPYLRSIERWSNIKIIISSNLTCSQHFWFYLIISDILAYLIK